MRTHSSLDALRARRRGLLGLLVPLLTLNWVGVAALPCAAMGTDTRTEAATSTMVDAVAAHAHDQDHHAHGAKEAPSHPACPHCVHAPEGAPGSDASAHAGCGAAPANTLDDTRRPLAKQDLGVAIPITAATLVRARANDAFATHSLDAIPPPTRALYLEHCVFLN